jgi:short-subunit dehydrogenase
MYTGHFDAFAPDAPRWKEMLDVNIMHVTMMTSFFKDKLIARQAEGKAKSALINVSSAMGYLQGSKGAAVYSSSKSFVTYYTTALGWELRDKLDVQCLTPNLTRTSLLQDITRKASPLTTISALDCARGSLRDLGHGGMQGLAPTAGDFRHDIQIPPYRVLSEIPVFHHIMGFFLGKFFQH